MLSGDNYYDFVVSPLSRRQQQMNLDHILVTFLYFPPSTNSMTSVI